MTTDTGGWTVDVEESERLRPIILPPKWRQFPAMGRGGFIKGTQLRVVMSVDVKDGKKWHHVSVSKAKELPTWAEMREVKDLFMGVEVTAVQVLAKGSEWVNVHPYCLHLWRPLDDNFGVLPDFRRGVLGL